MESVLLFLRVVPFVEILWKPDLFDRDRLLQLRDVIPVVVSQRFTEVDPEHPVTAGMVDVRVITVGDLDRINPDLYITVLARSEPARLGSRDRLARAIADDLAGVVPGNTLVEVILSERSSPYEYDSS